MAYWICALDGFVANSEEEKRQHFIDEKDDSAHNQYLKEEAAEKYGEAKGKAESKIKDAKDKVKDLGEDIKDKAKDIFS